MEMHQIRYFLAVARTLNFTQAADECHVAQPSLSRAIKKLEEELGGELFRRERSLTHLTELGRIMQPLLAQAYDTASSAKLLATSYRKGTYAPLRIALASAIDMRVLVKPLSNLMATMAGVELKFYRGTPEEVAQHLKSGDSELAIAGPIDWDRLRSYNLFNTDFRLFLNRSHRLADAGSVSLAELQGERLHLRPYCAAYAQVSQALADNGVHPSVCDIAVSDHDILALLDTDLGVSIMAALTAHGDGVCSVPIDDLDVACTIQLHTVIGRQQTPAAAGLIQLLRSANWRAMLGARAARSTARRRLPAGEAHA